jgi:DNA-directed RNA polymerase specialized sigma24 family protein
MSRKKKQPRPYIMRGGPRPKRRSTVLDKPDTRVKEQQVRRLTPAQIQTVPTQGRIDPRVRGVDRILERWAVTHGDGEHLPLMARSEPLYLSSQDRPTALDEAEARIVETAVKSAPDWARRVVRLHYRKRLKREEIQEELAIKRLEYVNELLHEARLFFLGMLRGMGLPVNSRTDVGDV